jgi:hypothetical protein
VQSGAKQSDEAALVQQWYNVLLINEHFKMQRQLEKAQKALNQQLSSFAV